MCNNNRNANSVEIDPTKIVERITKGFDHLPISPEDIKMHKIAVAATVQRDYDQLTNVQFVERYIEWIPTFMSSAVLEKSTEEVQALIEHAAQLRRDR